MRPPRPNPPNKKPAHGLETTSTNTTPPYDTTILRISYYREHHIPVLAVCLDLFSSNGVSRGVTEEVTNVSSSDDGGDDADSEKNSEDNSEDDDSENESSEDDDSGEESEEFEDQGSDSDDDEEWERQQAEAEVI